MTNEEALRILKTQRICGDDLHEAFDMAIKALEDSRWIPVTERLPEENGRYLVTRGLNAYGALWNRVWMSFLYHIEGMEGCYCEKCVREIEIEDVLRTLEKLYNDYLIRPDECKALDWAIRFIKEHTEEEPTIEERKNGRWIVITKMDGRTLYECSVCGKRVIYDDLMDLTNYCDHCGAKMEGAEEEKKQPCGKCIHFNRCWEEREFMHIEADKDGKCPRYKEGAEDVCDNDCEHCDWATCPKAEEGAEE